jgi:putative NADPH-quinone reductase
LNLQSLAQFGSTLLVRETSIDYTKKIDMKHLVVVAHPAEESFTMGLARGYAAELEKLGHSHRTYDRYRTGFDPILVAPELVPVGADRPVGADIAQAQDDIRVADVLTVLFHFGGYRCRL